LVGGTGLGSGNGSQFSYDDGQWLTGLQTRYASYEYNGWADIAVPEGAGRITVWLGCAGSGASSFTATLAMLVLGLLAGRRRSR
jgi:MYXO-CTERM domain-containing protein